MRKWNKLLALMLAMAMVLGMATTAFAAEDDAATADGGETPVEETNEDAAVDETTPAEGEETAPVEETPAEETPVEAGYTDVTEANWFYEAVTYVTENGLVDGETETTFAPSADMTRADMIVALYRMAGSPEVTGENPFTDVAADADYYAAVIWGTSNGVINGTSETTFSPDDSLQRQAFATMLYRYEALLTADETTDETAPAEEVPAEGETTDETTSAVGAPADEVCRAVLVTQAHERCQRSQETDNRLESRPLAQLLFRLRVMKTARQGTDVRNVVPRTSRYRAYFTSDFSQNAFFDFSHKDLNNKKVKLLFGCRQR